MSLLAARDRFESSSGGGLKLEKDKDKDKDKDKKEKSSSKDDSGDKAVKEALRSGEWKEVKDANGKTYYYNTKTKKTTWDLKKELKKIADEVAAASSPPPAAAQPAPAAAEPATPPPAAQPAPVAADASSPPPQPVVPRPVTAQPAAASTPPPQPATVAPSTPAPTATTSRPPAATSGPSFGSELPSIVPYVDPVERLLKHNEDLRKVVAGGSRGQVAIDFQQRYDALERTNNALNVQLERLRVEHESMAVALMDANKKIHEQQATIAKFQPTAERSKDEEIMMTLSHLREQNRVLVTQCAELSTLLARGLNETAARVADNRAASGDYVGSAATASESGARLISRFLDSGARHALCPNCVLSVTRYRDKLLGPSETNVGRTPLSTAGSPGRGYDPYAAVGGNAVPAYRPVPDITSPPASHYYSEPQPPYASSQQYQQQQQQHQPPESAFSYGIPPAAGNASLRAGAPTESPPVMFGGFVVRNARVPA